MMMMWFYQSQILIYLLLFAFKIDFIIMIIELELKEYLVIKEALEEAPYKKVAALLVKLDRQVAAQLQQPTPAEKAKEE